MVNRNVLFNGLLNLPAFIRPTVNESCSMMTAHASAPSNISRSSVIRCMAKCELTNKRCHEGMFCSEIEVFRQENGHICYIICRGVQYVHWVMHKCIIVKVGGKYT